MSFYANLKKWKVSFGGAPVAASSGTFDSLTVTPFTAGSVVFSGAGGTYAQDNANLFWDDTNNRLGIGTSVPDNFLSVNGIIGSGISGGAIGGELRSYQAGSTVFMSLKTDNALARSGLFRSNAGFIAFFNTGTGSTHLDCSFGTAPLIISVGQVASLTVQNPSGRVGRGITSPTAELHIKAGTATASTAPLKFTSGPLNTTPEAGAEEFLTNDRYYTGTDGVRRRYAANGEVIRLKGFTVATLPAGTQGDTAFVTDATTPTWNGALTGGGTVTVPVFYNGTAWVSA